MGGSVRAAALCSVALAWSSAGCRGDDRARPAPVRDAAGSAADAPASVTGDAGVTRDALVLRPRRQVQQIQLANAEALLANLAARLTAPTGLWSRLRRAKAIVHGTIASTDIKSHVPAKAALGDPEVQKSVLQGELMMNVVDVTVERWLEGSGGNTVVAVYPSPNQASSADPAGPATGESGLVLLERLPATPLGRELAKVKGAYGIAIVEPVVLPDLDGTLAAALAFERAGDLLQFTKTLATAKAGALQILIGIASRNKRFEPALRVRLRATPETAETLLVRAALWQLGDKKAALEGLTLSGLDKALDPLDMFGNGDGTLTGASADTPIGLP